MEFENDPLRVNPWNVGSLEDFLVYSCPECLTFERSKYAFVEHATNEHPSCHELMFSLGFFEPESSVKKEAMGEIDPVEFVTDVIGEPVQPVQLQSEIVSISKIKTEQQESNPLPPLPPLMDIGINKNEESFAHIKRVLNVSEHETSAELRTPSFIFFEKLVPAKAKIQANIWEDRTEIPLGPKENVMYVMKNFFPGILGVIKPLRVLEPVGPAALKVQFLFEPVMVCGVIVTHHNALADVGTAVISDVAHVAFHKKGCCSSGRLQVLYALGVSFRTGRFNAVSESVWACSNQAVQ